MSLTLPGPHFSHSVSGDMNLASPLPGEAQLEEEWVPYGLGSCNNNPKRDPPSRVSDFDAGKWADALEKNHITSFQVWDPVPVLPSSTKEVSYPCI